GNASINLFDGIFVHHFGQLYFRARHASSRFIENAAPNKNQRTLVDRKGKIVKSSGLTGLQGNVVNGPDAQTRLAKLHAVISRDDMRTHETAVLVRQSAHDLSVALK